MCLSRLLDIYDAAWVIVDVVLYINRVQNLTAKCRLKFNIVSSSRTCDDMHSKYFSH